jgi:hypothetical protein
MQLLLIGAHRQVEKSAYCPVYFKYPPGCLLAVDCGKYFLSPIHLAANPSHVIAWGLE